MNSFPVAIAWCVLQVTILSLFAIAWHGLLRRAGPQARSLALFSGLTLIVVLTLFAVSPWPRWSTAALSNGSLPETSVPRDGLAQAGPDSAGAEVSSVSPAARAPAGPPPVVEFWNALGDEFRRQTRPAFGDRWTWPTVLAALLVVGAGFGSARLCLGLILVRSYRRQSRPIPDPEILELRDILQAELGCRREIALYESDTLVTAATVGWRRPIVILPAQWRTWSEAERQAVLAHEIAHIQRHDFPTWVAAQVALVLHFYHPFVHWLCGRLRLEQELAADAAAARIAGGQQVYLTTLAAMALRQADRPLAWPARTFLPTRGTFMRRIEMLRDTRPPATTLSTGMRVITVGVLLAAGFVVAGFRGGSDSARAGVGELALQAVGTSLGASEPVSLAYVPRDAILVMTARPAAVLALPAFEPVRMALEKQGGIEALLGITFDRIEQITVMAVPQQSPAGPPVPPLTGIIIRLLAAEDAAAAVKKFVPQSLEREYAGQRYLAKSEGRGSSVLRVDDKTLVFSEDEPSIKRIIVAGDTGASTTKWAEAWSKASRAEAAVLINTASIRGTLDAATQQSPGPAAILNTLSPLWQKADLATISLELGESARLQGTMYCANAADATRVQETLAAAVTLLKNLMSQGRDEASRSTGKEGPMVIGILDLADSVIDTVKVGVSDNKVELVAKASTKELTTLTAAMVPAVSAARAAARRTQSMNNLKQIGLAFHNYHDATQSFPPAVLYGPDGKTPYSWRVAILPYIEQAQLYNQYKFNESWDSENNKKILEKMPAIFRDPTEPETSRSASYFALTGPATMFSGKEGTKLFNVTDGLSNTILIVEAKRDIPWTKPEDIPYAADQALPKLGGHYDDGFQALLGDGAVRFISKAVAEQTLRMLFTKSGGEVIPNY